MAGDGVEITFRTRKLERELNSKRRLQQEYGERMARLIKMRLAVLENAANLAEAQARLTMGLHQLRENRAGQFAVYLVHPYRLIFRPNHNSIPLKDDGGINLTEVTAITIIEVVDYHPNR